MSRGTTQGVTASFGLITVRGEGCYATRERNQIRWLGCAAIDVGSIRAKGESGGPIVEGVQANARWLAGVAIGRMSVALGRMSFFGQGELLVPMFRDSFGLTIGPDFFGKYQPPAVAVGARLGIAYQFVK